MPATSWHPDVFLPHPTTVPTMVPCVRWWQTHRVVAQVGLNGNPVELYDPQCPDRAMPERPAVWSWLGVDATEVPP